MGTQSEGAYKKELILRGSDRWGQGVKGVRGSVRGRERGRVDQGRLKLARERGRE